MAAKKLQDIDHLQYMTFREIAERTTYHIKTIERFARNNVIKSTKIRGKRVVTVAAFKEFLESNLEDGKLE